MQGGAEGAHGADAQGPGGYEGRDSPLKAQGAGGPPGLHLLTTGPYALTASHLQHLGRYNCGCIGGIRIFETAELFQNISQIRKTWGWGELVQDCSLDLWTSVPGQQCKTN